MCSDFSSDISQDSRDCSRLKVLKDEVKKPYFISLKKFLWQEGVRGPDDDVKGLKVYPSRKSEALIPSILTRLIHLPSWRRSSSERLFLVAYAVG